MNGRSPHKKVHAGELNYRVAIEINEHQNRVLVYVPVYVPARDDLVLNRKGSSALQMCLISNLGFWSSIADSPELS